MAPTFFAALSLSALASEPAPISLSPPAPVTFVFTSDVHYGIARGSFQGAVNVDASVVGTALVRKINALPTALFPADHGLRAGEPIGPIDFVVITGDLTNRQELYPKKIQSAAESWRQFEATFIRSLSLQNRQGEATPLYLVPGNHDVTNAVGSSSKMVPAKDATTLAEIYNRALQPTVPLTKDTFHLERNRIHYARDLGGAKGFFLTVWPDSEARAWMEEELKNVGPSRPVFIFCHDPPDPPARHFINPNGSHDINETDKFENLLSDSYADGSQPDGETKLEQRALATFLKAHRNIVGFFHGHTNYAEFYTWKGPDGNLALATFRADSPMKGSHSGKDEKKLSFNVVTFDVANQTLTARECLWNPTARADDSPNSFAWGASVTVSLAPR